MTLPNEPAALAPETIRKLRDLATRWTDVGAAERANYQVYVIELCEAIGVERPRPAAPSGRMGEGVAYQFEFPVKTTSRDGDVSTNFIDLFKDGCFALEAKDAVEGAGTTRLLTKAFGQVSNYAKDLSDRPPYIMVLDVGKTLIVWDRWAGTYGGFHLGQRIDLRTLADQPDNVALLRDIWTDPSIRDPRRRSQRITVEIAGLLAELASTLEARGNDAEKVARFLIRCVFSMFAEDVQLLPQKAFTNLLDAVADAGPQAFVDAAEDLWKAMDAGTRFGYHKLLRFNGHFFANAEALPLDKSEIAILRRAAEADWSAVEPSIFGTLLVRALTPEERHRLGAEYTPRAFIERLVRPTVEEPVRERWTAVQAEVLQLMDTSAARKARKDKKDSADARKARKSVQDFHAWLRGLQILDPACGSGNFLYVTMHTLKRIEVEVFRLLRELSGGQLDARLSEIDPSQFHGIEVKPWAREIAELTLWIGFHQFWRQQHGDVQPDEPLLRDTGTLEQRDAVLAWDSIRHVPEKDRPDPTPRIVHPVTGKLVPDPNAKLKYYEYVGARQAEWPEADFIVGNPPYLGNKRMREEFGDGYVDSLRRIYPDLPESIDFVMYWWVKAAICVAKGETAHAGLITTNSITQSWNRPIVESAISDGALVRWAAPDHPWVDEADGAAVRVAMTVLTFQPKIAIRVEVDENAHITSSSLAERLNADLTSHADVPRAASVTLLSNDGLASRGFQLIGAGFQLKSEEALTLLRREPNASTVLRPYLHGKDLASRSRNHYVIDFALMTEDEARKYPTLFDIVRTRVKPERDANARSSYSKFWWRFGEPRRQFRNAVAGLNRYIATPQTAKYRYFTFLSSTIAPDDMLVAISSNDGWVLGVLSASVHIVWSVAAGARLGIGNDSRYNQSTCFSPFPFPDPSPELRTRIATIAESLDAHRKAAIDRDVSVTMTGMYNVIAKLRSGEALTPKERAIHEIAACGVLRDMHDELDKLVAEAYGWPWPMSDAEILDRLVALHDVRVAEEAQGIVRWLRPEFQAPNAVVSAAPAELALTPGNSAVKAPEPAPWPAEAVEQIGALKRLASAEPVSVQSAVQHFAGARREIVTRHLETLEILGELRVLGDGRYASVPVA
ncbi:MAG: class I SAM-dependent DNA methyltransferase [Gemmatimonas sp.]